MNKKEKILFLTTELPYPLDNGGKIRTYNMIKGISNEYDIDLICFSENEYSNSDIKDLLNICLTVNMIKMVFTNSKNKWVLLKNLVKSILKNTPFIIEKFRNYEYEKIIDSLTSKNKYYAIVFDHLNITNYYEKICYVETKKILSEHNCEYIILKRRYEKEKNFFKKLYFKYEYRKTKKFEQNICEKFNRVIMLTEEDKKHVVNKYYEKDNIDIVPISVDTRYIKKHYNQELKNLMFLGTMSWYPNEHGVLWFMENVWPKINEKYKNMKLYIVGKNPNKNIEQYKNENIIVTGYVDNVNEYIEKCDICVVPLFIGGGMRVKILECMSKGIPCISTSIGAEGIDVINGENILIANNGEEFIRSIDLICNDNLFYKNINKNAIDLIDKKYSITAVNKKIIEVLEKKNYKKNHIKN